MIKHKANIIAGFPGIGKTHYASTAQQEVSDSDSSLFDKANFPTNYIAHVKTLLHSTAYILVSSHVDVRNALERDGIAYTFIVPHPSLKDEYLERYRQRGSPAQFINLLATNWCAWTSVRTGENFIRLGKGEYLSDVVNKEIIV